MNRTRGQATVELLLILGVLFLLLAFSVQIFSVQRASVSQQEVRQSAQRNAELVAQTLTSVLASPIGTSVRVFIPLGVLDQNILIRSGFVQVQSGGELAIVSIPAVDLNASTFRDGRFIQVSRSIPTVQVQ